MHTAYWRPLVVVFHQSHDYLSCGVIVASANTHCLVAFAHHCHCPSLIVVLLLHFMCLLVLLYRLLLRLLLLTTRLVGTVSSF